MLMRAYKPNQPVVPQGNVFGERIAMTLECQSCRHTYPRAASPKQCPNCSYDRNAGNAEEIPPEFERFRR